MIDPVAPRLVCLDLRGGSPRPVALPRARMVLCLGNFDGVHVAHTRLLREGIRLSQTLTASRGEEIACGVFCFFCPSSDFFRPSGAPLGHLTTLREKIRLVSEIGIRYACLCDFSEVRALPPDDFVTLLRTHFDCVGTVCGYNYRFGAGAVGQPQLLAERFGPDAMVILSEMQLDGQTVSSTNIRAALSAGDAQGAARLLGRPYSLTATVTHGKQLGRTLGFPTANQFFPVECLVPAHGVYAALCHTPDGIYPAVANVGLRPTVNDHARVNCESYILGYDGDLYGRRIRTELLCRLRPEERFPDLDALQAAIARDAAAAADYIRARRLLS